MGDLSAEDKATIWRVIDNAADPGPMGRLAQSLREDVARLEAGRDALAREKRTLANGAFSEMARVEKERDELGASAARMREQAIHEEGQDDDGYVYYGCGLCYATCVEGAPFIHRDTCALADPAPLEWLAAHDAEVVKPYREALREIAGRTRGKKALVSGVEEIHELAERTGGGCKCPRDGIDGPLVHEAGCAARLMRVVDELPHDCEATLRAEQAIGHAPTNGTAAPGDVWRCGCGALYVHDCDEPEGCAWLPVLE